MKYKVRKSPEYSPSTRLFTLDELEQGLRVGDVDPASQVQGESGGPWMSIADVSQVVPDPDVVSKKRSEFSQETPTSASPVGKRYIDAYLTAGFIDGFGSTIKMLAGIFMLLVVLGGFILSTNVHNGGAFIFAGLVVAVAFGVPIYVLGVLVAAQGQILKATLDTAVHSSPFLSDDQRASIMSIKR